MGFAGKLVDKRIKGIIDKHFMAYDAINFAVKQAKLEREDPGAHTGNTGYQLPDPTGNKACSNLAEVAAVGVLLQNGKYCTVYHPERWLHIMRDCFHHYQGDMIGQIVVDRYISHRAPAATQGLFRIGESTYYDWVDTFLTDAAVLAAVQGLIPAEFEAGQPQKLF